MPKADSPSRRTSRICIPDANVPYVGRTPHFGALPSDWRSSTPLTNQLPTLKLLNDHIDDDTYARCSMKIGMHAESDIVRTLYIGQHAFKISDGITYIGRQFPDAHRAL